MYPAGEPAGSIRVSHVQLASGPRVRVLQAGPRDGEAVVLVHGWAASVYSFKELLPLLAAAGRRVIAYDLPGHGLSDKPAGSSVYGTPALADSIAQVVQALAVDRFVLVGHSLGGALALDLVLRGDARVRALVLVSAVALGRIPALPLLKLLAPPIVDRVAPALLTRGLVRTVLRVAYGMPGRPTERDVDEYWAPSQFDEYAHACRACLHEGMWRPRRTDELRRLTLPVLAIAGERDRLVRGSLAGAAAIPDASCIAVPEAGHIVVQESAPRVAREILGFLAKRA